MAKSKIKWSLAASDLMALLSGKKKNFSLVFKKQSWVQKASWISLALTLLLGLLYLLYSLFFLGRVYPNSYIGANNFSHLKTEHVKNRLNELNNNLATPIKLTFNDQVYSLSPSDVDWNIDVDQTAERIVSRGRSNGAWRSFAEQISSLFVKHQIEPVYSYSQDDLDTFITNIAETVDEPAVDASAKFVNDELKITQETVGKRLNREEIRQMVIAQWGGFAPSTISLELRYDVPKIVVGSEEDLRAQVGKLSESKLSLSWDGGKKDLKVADIHKLIGFVGAEPDSPITDGGISQKTLAAQFTIESIKSYLNELAAGIDVPAKDPKLIIKDGVLAVSESSQTGKVVDKEASAETILAALSSGNVGPVALTLKTQSPVLTESMLNELGIKERIGYGMTNFIGSPANRKANIANGVRLLQSALIKPGEEFSTVKTLGAVDGTTGFLPELVIKENKTVPEYGGGLCQVSTTLFRSVLNAGLKVTERSNHSYRVSYYEPPVGLDATIYLPKPDFKFLNDTGAYILVQGRVEGTKVIFELWGTSDGRTSSLTDPVVSNIKDPGDPIYTDTDTLFKGEVKQTEKAHQGATALVYYTVSRGGQVINKQTFKSVYKPWPAKFLVGTKEPPVTDKPAQ